MEVGPAPPNGEDSPPMAMVLAFFRAIASFVSHALRYAEVHTGVPAIVVAGVVLVVGFRLFKKSLRFAVEVGVVVGLLGMASLFGWIRF